MTKYRNLKDSFKHFNYFYKYLGSKIFIGILLSFLVGLFDSIGLTLFIPLIQLAINPSEDVGELDKISAFIIENSNFDLTIRNVFLLILILFSLKGIFKFFDIYFRVWTHQLFMRSVRNYNIDLLSNYSYERFVNFDSGHIQNALSSEITRVNQAYKNYFKSLHYLILVLVYIGMAMLNSFFFSVIVLLLGVAMNSIFSAFFKRTKYFSRKYSTEANLFQGLLMQKVSNFQYLKATGTAKLFGERLKKRIKKLEDYQRKLGVFEALLSGLREPLTMFVVFIAILLFLNLFSTPFNSIILSLFLLYRSITFYMAMQEHWNGFLGNEGSLNNVQQFSKELESFPEFSGNERFSSLNKSLRLKDVSYSYEGGDPVLKNIDLEIFKNETIAIIGESGAGKSTLLNILAGLIELKNGSYLIDSKNFRNIDKSTFKERIGYIVQDPVIFNDTIYNNITLWDDYHDDKVKKFTNSLKKSALFNFVEAQPDKEKTFLGFNGINISGGQKQRISIARELYKDIDILFMDEATSNLDSETEYEVQSNINQLKGQFTIVIIAHRLSTVKSADRIVMLKDGKINAIGDFENLIETSAEFRRMVELQML